MPARRRRPPAHPDRARPRTTCTGWPSASSSSSCGPSGGGDDRLVPRVVASSPGRPSSGRSSSCSRRATARWPCASSPLVTTGISTVLVDLDLRRLRPRGGGLPVLREAVPGAAARHQLRAGRRRHQPADGPPHVHHHLRRASSRRGRWPCAARSSMRCSSPWSPGCTGSSSPSISSSSSSSTSWPCCPCICSSPSGARRARCARAASSRGPIARPGWARRNTRP